MRSEQALHVGIDSLFLIPGGVGGSETYLRNVIAELTNLEEPSAYTLYTNRENAGTFEFNRAAVREVRCAIPAVRRPLRLLYEYAVLPRRAHRMGIDVLFAPGFTTPTSRRYATVATILDMRHIDLPGSFSPAFLMAHSLLTLHAARTATRILTLSEHAKRRIIDVYRVPDEKVLVSYLAAEPLYFAPVLDDAVRRVREQYGLSTPYILSVATLHPHKNLGTLIEAFKAVRATSACSLQLALVGLPGEAAQRLRQEVQAAGLTEAVVLTGWVPDADLPALYRGAEVFVLPSRYEGFGIPVLEAMASGVPVITTTAASLPEVAGDAALLFHPDDAAGLVQALRQVLTNNVLRHTLIGRGRVRSQLFTWHATAQQTNAALRQAASLRHIR
jgi:glycosyltransferase involved in cell wall biosynthesis